MDLDNECLHTVFQIRVANVIFEIACFSVFYLNVVDLVSPLPNASIEGGKGADLGPSFWEALLSYWSLVQYLSLDGSRRAAWEATKDIPPIKAPCNSNT